MSALGDARAWVAYLRKALAVAAGIAAMLVSLALASGWVLTVCQLVIGAATIAGVYRLPKGPRPSSGKVAR